MHPSDAFEPFFAPALRHDDGGAPGAVAAFRFDGWSHAPLDLGPTDLDARRAEAEHEAAPALA